MCTILTEHPNAPTGQVNSSIAASPFPLGEAVIWRGGLSMEKGSYVELFSAGIDVTISQVE